MKRRFAFICVASSAKEYDKKVQDAYWKWRGIQPRGTDAGIDVFMADYDAVTVKVEKCQHTNGDDGLA